MEQSPLGDALPYTAGISEDIRLVCRKYDMKVIFMSGLSLHSVLIWVKDPLPMEKWSKVMYRIPCSCSKVYIGETRVGDKVEEAPRSLQEITLEKSAVAEHARKDQHAIE